MLQKIERAACSNSTWNTLVSDGFTSRKSKRVRRPAKCTLYSLDKERSTHCFFPKLKIIIREIISDKLYTPKRADIFCYNWDTRLRLCLWRRGGRAGWRLLWAAHLRHFGVPSSFWKQSANITAQTAGSQTKWCPCSGRIHAQVFTWMPFAEHICLLTWYRRLWIRLLPRLWWGKRMLFILYMYFLKRLEKGGFDRFALTTILWTAPKCK